jgi:hypothetical protein
MPKKALTVATLAVASTGATASDVLDVDAGVRGCGSGSGRRHQVKRLRKKDVTAITA